MPPRLPELVGRAMIDAEFLAELRRAPDDVLARYDLTDAERTAVRSALDRLSHAPPGDQALALRTALLRRVAT
ncbi:MAG TPA: hypothetical protein VID04_06890 [Methylomirabilota bacterium]|jgi:hypothetical protein